MRKSIFGRRRLTASSRPRGNAAGLRPAARRQTASSRPRGNAAGLRPAARRKQSAILLLLACILLVSACERPAPAIDTRLLLTPVIGTTSSSDTPAPVGTVSPTPTRAPTFNATAGPALIPSATPTRPAPASTLAAAPTAVPATNTPIAEPATPTRTFAGRTMTVKAFMIARGDGGALGPKIGCGDSAVAVNRTLPYSTTPLTDALKELLTIHDPFYGQSGLYNSLNASRLQVESVALSDGVATIRLTGSMTIAGDCDDPRFEAQLRRTALQFPTVRVANIYINGKGLGCLTSGKGC